MFYPLMIEIEDMNILIVGGGKIAYRKASYLKNYGKRVKIISDKFHDKFFEEEDDYDLVRKNFEFADLDGMDMVYAATSNKDLNVEITRVCRERRILVNNVDTSIESSFINTGNFTKEIDGQDVIVSVSTFGKNCGLTKKIRNQIQDLLDGRD